VGVDAQHPHHIHEPLKEGQFREEVAAVAPHVHPDGDNWQPGDAPSQVLEWAVESLAKAGTLSIIGVYPQGAQVFPIGAAMNKNLTINMGNCHHRKYIPKLIEMVLARRIDPSKILTQIKPITDVIAAFESFDRRESGWVKVELQPQRQQASEGDEEILRGEQKLDEAVAESFPASDPPSHTAPRST
jgi:threonine dehydrogenase-like Zn-dependent dehydrogenase